MSTIQELAGQLAQAFQTGERNDGTKSIKLVDGSPDWMTDVVYTAHGDILKPEYQADRRFLVKGGFGRLKHTAGSKIYGIWLADGSEDHFSGYDIDVAETNALSIPQEQQPNG